MGLETACVGQVHILVFLVVQEMKFQMAIQENVNEEKQNQLSWQVKLGDNAATFEQQANILEDRIADWRIYKVRIAAS